MKAYLIDPFEQSVRPVEHDNTWQDICRQMQCQTPTAVIIDSDGERVFVDKEGLQLSTEALLQTQRFFTLKCQAGVRLLPGRGLLLGTDAAGGATDAKIKLDELRALVGWPKQENAVRWALSLITLLQSATDATVHTAPHPDKHKAADSGSQPGEPA
ncbi:MAG: hypothetical protein ABI612_09150 [Betaproteobacteria bacterium]